VPKFDQFGDKVGGGYLTYRVRGLKHPNAGDADYDTSWNPRYSYSTFFRVRRVWPRWYNNYNSRKTLIWRGDDSSQNSPKLDVARRSHYYYQT
jgi:hypothetical protein